MVSGDTLASGLRAEIVFIDWRVRRGCEFGRAITTVPAARGAAPTTLCAGDIEAGALDRFRVVLRRAGRCGGDARGHR